MCIICEDNYQNKQGLKIENCNNIIEIPNIPTLETIKIIDCPNITTINNNQIIRLFIINCPKIKDFSYLTNLECLHMYGMPLYNINILDIQCLHLNKLNNIIEIPNFSSLKNLNIYECDKLIKIPEKQYKKLHIKDCNKLIST